MPHATKTRAMRAPFVATVSTSAESQPCWVSGMPRWRISCSRTLSAKPKAPGSATPRTERALQHLKAEAHQRYKDSKGEVSSGSEFQSGELYRHHIRRHTRMTHAPNGKYSQPLTAAQDVGWSAHEAELIPPTAPKQSCAETVYAAELIKSGVFY